MKDLPTVASGNLFILYSDVEVGGSPSARATVSYTSKTGIASIVGGLDNDNLTITPSGSGYTIALKVNRSRGFYSFTSTVTTNGDANHEAAAVQFTLYVVLMGHDEVFNIIRKQYRVGDRVNEQIGLSPANGIHDYRVIDGRLRAMDVDSDDVQYASGITIAVRQVGSYPDVHDEVWMTGTAKRPGCYLAWIDCTTWDKPQNGPLVFGSGSNMPAPVIVSITDRVFEPGQLCVKLSNTVTHNPAALRLVYCADNVFPNMGGWFRVHMSGSVSSGVWLGDWVRDEVEHHQWQVSRLGDNWVLKTRVWEDRLEDPQTPPDWSTLTSAFDPNAATPCGGVLATAAVLTDGGNPATEAVIPPSSGWSNSAVLSGDARYSVPGYGIFDYKSEKDGRAYYQQECIHTRQYAGWTRPAERQFNDGRLLWLDGNGKWNIYAGDWSTIAEDVTPLPINGVIVPYAPPVVEKIGSDVVRDVSFATDVALNVNKTLAPNALALANGNTVGGVWGWFNAERLIVPYNGTSGDQTPSAKPLVYRYRGYTYYQAQSHRKSYDNIYAYSEGATIQTEDSDYRSGVEARAELPKDLPFGTRSGAVPLMFGNSPASAAITTEHYLSGRKHNYFADYGDAAGTLQNIIEEDTHTYSTTSQAFTPNNDLPLLFYYPFAAPDAKNNKWHQRWFAARLVGGGGRLSWVDNDHNVYVMDGLEDITDTAITGSRILPGRYFTPRPFRFGSDGFAVETEETVTETGTFTAIATCYVANWAIVDGFYEVQSCNIVNWYELKIEKNITYTQIGEFRTGGSDFSATYTKKTIPAGIYGSMPAATVETGAITTVAEYDALITEAKGQAAAFVDPSSVSGGAIDTSGVAKYGWRDEGTSTESRWEAGE